MVLIISLREQDLNIYTESFDISKITPKDIREAIINLFLRLCWLDLKIAKSIKEVYLVNDTKLVINSVDVNKIEIGKIIVLRKKINTYFRRLNPNQIQYVTEMIRNTIVLNKNDYSPEKIKIDLTNKEIYFVCNIAGDMTFHLIEELQSTSLHPLQYSVQNFRYTEICEVDQYLQMLKNVMKVRHNAIRIRAFPEGALSIIEMCGKDTLKELNSTETENKIFLQGGDNYLIEEIVKYLLKGHLFNFLWDFRVGIPEFEREYDSLIFFNIDNLSTSGDQSRFWLRVRDYNYSDKLMIVTAKDEKFKFSYPVTFEFKTIKIPTLREIKDNILRVLVFLVNIKTPKSMLWQVPNDYYESPLNTFIDDIKDITLIDKILDNMDLRLYVDKIYSIDFWYDFLQIKNKLLMSEVRPFTHSISHYLVPLSDEENKKIRQYGTTYSVRKNEKEEYTIELPSGIECKVNKSIGMDYWYYLVKHNISRKEPIDVEKLYTAIAGESYSSGDRTALLNKIRASVKHLYSKQAPRLINLADCFVFGEKGCFYEPTGNLRMKIIK